MKVVVLMGGRSAEREISLRTGEAILKALKELGCEAIALDLEENLCERLREIKPDKVFYSVARTLRGGWKGARTFGHPWHSLRGFWCVG